MDVDLRDLRYFVVVAEELHFGRAADRLFISQPALSKQIRHLERGLRLDLLSRDQRRRVSLTAAGEALLPIARELIQRWDEAQRRIADAATAAAATLMVGFSTTPGRGLLAAVLDRFSERWPTWQVQLRQVRWDDPTAGLTAEETDVAFVWLPLPRVQGIAWEVVATEPRWVALPRDHPLTAREQIPFTELLQESFVALPKSAGPLRDYWLAMDDRDGLPPHIGAEAATAEETFEAIANGLGVALLAAGNAEIYQRPGIIARPVTGLSPSQLAVAWRVRDNRSVVRDFVEACRPAR